jgi:hypothetical protein
MRICIFTGKLGLRCREIEGKSLDTFSRLKDIVQENSVETSGTGIDQFIIDPLVDLQSKCSTYFPEAMNDKYKRIMGPSYAHSHQRHYFSLEE